MRQVAFAVGMLFSLGFGISKAQAQHRVYQRVKDDYHQMKAEWIFNNRWPDPFLEQDRQAVRAPFVIMIDKGWQLQTTLGDHHFHVETQQLTRAGELHLRWILGQVPENRRTVYVFRGQSDEATSVRVDTVQQAIAVIVPKGSLPAVVQTNVAPPSSPADYADDITKKATTARPPPVLPAATSGSSSSSGT